MIAHGYCGRVCVPLLPPAATGAELGSDDLADSGVYGALHLGIVPECLLDFETILPADSAMNREDGLAAAE